jgi:hypothetical protein
MCARPCISPHRSFTYLTCIRNAAGASHYSCDLMRMGTPTISSKSLWLLSSRGYMIMLQKRWIMAAVRYGR